MTTRRSSRRRQTPTRWQVLRYGGPYSGRWRVVYEGPERTARKRYLREHARLRQGHLLLVTAQGKPVRHQWASRL